MVFAVIAEGETEAQPYHPFLLISPPGRNSPFFNIFSSLSFLKKLEPLSSLYLLKEGTIQCSHKRKNDFQTKYKMILEGRRETLHFFCAIFFFFFWHSSGLLRAATLTDSMVNAQGTPFLLHDKLPRQCHTTKYYNDII